VTVQPPSDVEAQHAADHDRADPGDQSCYARDGDPDDLASVALHVKLRWA